MLLQSMNQGGGEEKPSAPPPSLPKQRDDSEGAWPWFSGNIEDLARFRQAWEMHVRRFHHGMTPQVLVGDMRKYCVPRGICRMIEPARDPEEAWQIMESYFNRETRMLDRSIDEILGYGRMVNDNQTLAHYSRILMALELGSNNSPLRILEDDPEEAEPAWEGPCLMGDLCGGSHAPEKCSLFIGLSRGDRLVVVEKKQLCYLCFRHADSQPCKLQSSLPACSVGGCVRMHSKLLHEALQKEETRAIVIEVEDGPEEPGEDEEFYAANFELLGQEDEDEEEGLVSEDKAPPLVSSEGEPDEEPLPYAHLGEDRPRLCQQRVPLEVNGNLTSLHTLYD